MSGHNRAGKCEFVQACRQVLEPQYRVLHASTMEFIECSLKYWGLPSTRENLIKHIESMADTDTFGEDVLANAMDRHINASGCEIVFYDSMRLEADKKLALSKWPHSITAAVIADDKKRWERQRLTAGIDGRKSDDAQVSFEEFMRQKHLSKTNRLINTFIREADVQIPNDGTLAELQEVAHLFARNRILQSDSLRTPRAA